MGTPFFVWLNGALISAQDAAVPVTDRGLLLGDGVYETLVARGGRIIAGPEHWARLAAACEKLRLPCPDEATFLAALEAVRAANGLHDARLRVTVTNGAEPNALPTAGTTLATASPLRAWPPAEKVCTAPWVRNERGALAGIKSLSYAENLRCLAHARAKGCGDALLANTRDELCEGTGSNVFVVIQGVVKTPPLTSGCLPGVTRALVLQACAIAGLPCQEEPLPMTVLATCDECFLTSATRDVHPVAELNGRPLPAPGKVTAQVMQAYARLTM